VSWLREKGDNQARSGIVTVLDIGSSKVCCIIARLKPAEGDSLQLRQRTHRTQVIGIGHQRSQGVKSGMIVDLDRAETAIRQAVDAAERMAGVTVDSLIANVSAGKLKSDTFSATINLGGHEVDSADIKRVLAAGAKKALKSEREVIHSLPVSFSLDTERGIRDPQGMVGDHLGVDIHVLTGDAMPMRNLELAINRSHLSVESMVATPYASGLAALVDDELEMGAACIDMGGGSTSISVFTEGRFAYADSSPIGGHHVTLDLARGLSTSIDEAERLKVVHGSTLPVANDDQDTISIQPIGDERSTPNHLPRALISRIIRARVEETLELLRERLMRSGYSAAIGKRVVLTGGASQLSGMPEAARRILGRNVRIGRPLGVAGLPEAAKGPAFSTSVGLLVYPQMVSIESVMRNDGFTTRMTGTGGRLHRVSQWLRDSF
jgi:cell division protein FtsA